MTRMRRTAAGKEIDFDAFLAKNEKTHAVGNNPVNARGDEIGPDGRILRTKDERAADYYSENPKAVKTKPSPEPVRNEIRTPARKRKNEKRKTD